MRIQATRQDCLALVDSGMLPYRFKVRKAHGKHRRKLRKLPKFDKGVRA